MKFLIVIDMQPYFAAANKPETIQAVLEQIRAAKQAGDYIVIVEYDYDSLRAVGAKHGEIPTHKEILDEVEGYEKYVICFKRNDDGGKEIVDALAQAKAYPTKNIEMNLVGVNLDACVIRTARGLDDHFNYYKRVDLRSGKPARINIIEKACNSSQSVLPPRRTLIRDCSANVNFV
jgi:nicotinamidase-related amidase